jgi:hypothetical protein
MTLTAATAMAQEILVTPSKPNGWSFGTVTDKKSTTAKWFIGENPGVKHVGDGALWLFTGNNDGVVYARNSALKGTKVSDIGRLRYRTYTASTLENIAPIFGLRVDTNGDNRGDTWFFFEPSFQGKIPRNQWVDWNTIAGKWWTDKNGIGDLRPLDVWLKEYNLNSVVDYMQIQAGTWKDPKSVWGWSWLGADLVVSASGLNPEMSHNFEPDAVTAQSNTTINKFMVVNPVVIGLPTYYVDGGEKIEKLPIVDEPVQPEIAPKPEKPVEKEEAKPEVTASEYKTTDGLFVPLLFNGNTNITKMLSRIDEVGNPDAQLTGGGAFKFGGIPFYIPKNRDNVWDALVYNDDAEHKLVVKAGLEAVTAVHTIMNITVWGTEKAELFVEFRGAAGAFHKVELIANRDVRDWHKRTDDNLVSPSQVVWSRPLDKHTGHNPCEVRLDSQYFPLPDQFLKEELQSITIVDRGGKKSQRVFVVGVTAKVKEK